MLLSHSTFCSTLHLQLQSAATILTVLANMTTTVMLVDVQGELPDLQAFTDFFEGFSKCHKVIIDCTANEQVPLRYTPWLSSGIHVVTPNKKLCSGPLSEWTKVRNTAKEHATKFMYEVMQSYLHCWVLMLLWCLPSQQQFLKRKGNSFLWSTVTVFTPTSCV